MTTPPPELLAPSATDGAADAQASSAAPAAPLALPQRLLAAGIVLCALYFGRELLIPLALAVLLGFVLTPLVDRLRRWGLPQSGAVALVVVCTLGLLVAGGSFVAMQLRHLGSELPAYRSNIERKFDDLRKNLRAPGVFDQAGQVISTVQKQIDAAQADFDNNKHPQAKPAPPTAQRVEVVAATPSARERLSGLADGVFSPLAFVATVFIYLVLVLLDPGDLLDRLLRLLGGNLHRTTDALAEAGHRVTRYLTMQVIVNLSYALPMAAGLWLIGVPGFALWGVLSAVLRFIPYVGPLVGAVFPLLLALAVDPGWGMLLWTAGLIAALELVINNLIEPWLYGSSTGLSAMSLIVAATFWTALWGPVGLALSTPLTVCLLVFGRHLPGLAFLGILLGAEPALDAPTRLYQRVLAGSRDAAIEIATDEAQAQSPLRFYDDIAVPVLRRASLDHGEVASAEHRHRVNTGMAEVIDEVRRQHVGKPAGDRLDCLCIGGRWAIDTLGAQMAAHALALDGLSTDVVPAAHITADYMARLDPRGATTVCLVFFAAEPHKHAAVFCRRLKRRWPAMQVVILWLGGNGEAWRGLQTATGADTVVNAIAELSACLGGGASDAAGLPYLPAPANADDLARVQALRASGALDDRMREAFDASAKRAADIFDVPIALVSLIDDEWQLTHGDSSRAGRKGAGPPQPSVARSKSLCGHVVADAGTLVVPDIRRDWRFAGNPVLRERGIRFYAGAPLRNAQGQVYGTLCLLDTEPRSISEADSQLLAKLADEVMQLLA